MRALRRRHASWRKHEGAFSIIKLVFVHCLIIHGVLCLPRLCQRLSSPP